MRLASQAGRRIVGARGAAGRRRPQVLGVGVGVPSGPPRVTKAREVHCAPFGHTAPPPPIRGGRDRFRLKEIAAQQVCWRRLPRLPAPLLPPPPTGILTRASRRGRQSRETRDSRPRQASCEQASAPQGCLMRVSDPIHVDQPEWEVRLASVPGTSCVGLA
ncbi:uncharacterized protein LOC121824298 isoform X2 [Peromyscus maniculatus bairdii]|uniref:uncharacterized protein LOC121824298 isoform X2 n=1 Tax=Peromyscus maniculatus bairdii TaxID=230844 RepID=UPI003FCFCC36